MSQSEKEQAFDELVEAVKSALHTIRTLQAALGLTYEQSECSGAVIDCTVALEKARGGTI